VLLHVGDVLVRSVVAGAVEREEEAARGEHRDVHRLKNEVAAKRKRERARPASARANYREIDELENEIDDLETHHRRGDGKEAAYVADVERGAVWVQKRYGSPYGEASSGTAPTFALSEGRLGAAGAYAIFGMP
jgi:hypothetical protein